MRRRRYITSRREEVLDLLARGLEERGLAPTVRELTDQLGLRTPSTVQCHILNLEISGLIVRTDDHSRKVRLTVDGREMVQRIRARTVLEKQGDELTRLRREVRDRERLIQKYPVAARLLELLDKTG